MGAERIRAASCLLVAVSVLILSPLTAQGADHYVRAGASGNGSGGDWTNAWSSFSSINWPAVNPGDTVYIAGGTYGMLAVIKSGTAGHPITFKRATVGAHGAAAGWNNAYDARVIIDGGGDLAAIGIGEGGDWNGKSFITVDGVTKYGIWARNAMYGVRADRQPSSDITLRYIEMGDAGTYKLGEDGIQGSGDNLTVEHCYIHDNDSITSHGDGVQWFGGNNFVFRYNIMKNCGQIFMLTEIWNGTDNDYVDNLTVCYNVFYNRSGTHYDGIKWKLAPRNGFTWKIYNNTFDLDAPTGTGDWEDRVMAGPASPNIDFRNNAVVNSRYGSIGDNSHSYNGYDNAGTGKLPDYPTPLVETGSVQAADLGFVNSAGADWHLLATSPLIGKGTSVGLTQDFDGNPVPAKPSIGAFEVVTGGGGGGGGGSTNHPPVISSGPSATPNPTTAGEGVAFSAAATDADGEALTYAWDFGDGASGEGASTAHAFEAAGTYDASVTVTDTHGASASGHVAVVVSASNDGGGGDDGGGGGDGTIDLGSVALNSRVKIALPLPEGFAGSRLRFKTLSPLPSALRQSGGTLSGKARKAGVFTFDIQITKLERVRGSNGRMHTQSTIVTVTYRLTVR